MSDDKAKPGSDDGVVTSAPAASMGSLLTDLLSEAKKDVAAERQKLEQQIENKAAKERDRIAREEARKREEMQQKLTEETRLRNQALARREREQNVRKQPGTAEQVALKAETEAPVTAPRVVEPPAKKGAPAWLMAAMLLLGVGGGVGAMFALTPTAKATFPDVGQAAKVTIEQTVRAAGAEQAVTDDLKKANSRVAALEQKLETALAAQKKMAKDLEETGNELTKVQNQLAEAEAKGSKRSNGRRSSTKRTGGGLGIDSGVFK